MRITFRLRFRTHNGQSLFVSGNHPALGNGKLEQAMPMQYAGPEFWETTVDFPNDTLKNEVTINYFLRDQDGAMVRDWGNDRVITAAELQQTYLLIIDAWNEANFLENAFYTKPFKEVLFKRERREESGKKQFTHTFSVKAPLASPNETLCILGNAAELGGWNNEKPEVMDYDPETGRFNFKANLHGASFPVSYKYGIYDLSQKRLVAYESGENRQLADYLDAHKQTRVNDGFARLPVNQWRGAGVAVPVFSLRSGNGFGVGEFNDLKPLADWCHAIGLKLIQILPVNDTSASGMWHDSYPYAAISAFALHPLYLNLNTLTGGHKKLPAAMEAERQRLNALETVDYEAVMRAKLEFARSEFVAHKKETFEQTGYEEFFASNEHWLTPYAVFCALRDKFKTPDFNQWPAHQHYDAGKIAALLKGEAALREEVAFHYFIQYHLHIQLKAAVDHIHAKGVVLKGDIAIGVFKHGADVWQNPGLFKTDKQTGAPPDAFGIKGQNWGFPTYNWKRMAEDNYLWWKQRFEQMDCYFDAFRIDHILGFFRIWSNPADAVEGILGVFDPAIAVRVEEFGERGIHFDRERFTQPFINDAVVQEVFGERAGEVKKKFLTHGSQGKYALKPEYHSQVLVEQHFSTLEKSPANEKLKEGLFDLISNLLLLEIRTGQGRELHFRYGIEDTWSYKALDADTQWKLKQLYIDYFFRRQETLWKAEGMEKLPALKRVTSALICGEDLGMVPDCVPVVMKRLGLLSLEIQRMPKTLNTDFSRPAVAPYLSVVTPSTHDMSTIRGWWEEDRKVTQKFYNEELGLAGKAPEQCSQELCRKIIEQHFASPAMWSIFQLQDLFGMDETIWREDVEAERINVPANPKNYWRYRMHLSVEELSKTVTLNKLITGLIHRHRI